MLTGDFSTMGLADVLQWIDATRSSGILVIERSSESLWVQVESREVVRASEPPNQPVPLAALGGEPMPLDLARLGPELAIEHVYDQFLAPEGRFRFEPGAKGSGGLQVEVPLAELLMESVRLLDEWPAIEARFPNDGGKLESAGAENTDSSELRRAVVECARRNLTLEQARRALGLSRPALLRRVNDLVVQGIVLLPGVPPKEDITTRLLTQARALLKERQFDEAAHVFAALLASDPGAAAVRHLLRNAEEQQLEWLRKEIPADAVPKKVAPDAETGLLNHADREVLSRVNGRWDVGVIGLVSPFRETETLKSLRRLARLRLIELSAR